MDLNTDKRQISTNFNAIAVRILIQFEIQGTAVRTLIQFEIQVTAVQNLIQFEIRVRVRAY